MDALNAVLNALDYRHERTAAEITDRTGLASGTVRKHLADLYRQGVVARRPVDWQGQGGLRPAFAYWLR